MENSHKRRVFFDKVKSTLEFLANNHIIALLTYLALFIAFWHLFELTKVSKKTETLSNRMDTSISKLNRIVSEMPTQSIGVFPDNLVAINNFLKRISDGTMENSDKDTLFIVTDGIGYGQFSNPKLFESYKNLLIKVDRVMPVQLIIHDSVIKNIIRNEQFEKPDSSDYKVKFETYREYWISLIGKEKFDSSVKDRTSLQSFLRQKTNEFKTELLNGGIEIYETGTRQSIYLWAIKNEAIISFSTTRPIRGETSLITQEPNLISYCLFKAKDIFSTATKIN